jgi:hypothetical protein
MPIQRIKVLIRQLTEPISLGNKQPDHYEPQFLELTLWQQLGNQRLCYEPTKYGTGRAYRMQATGARQVGTGRTGVPRSRVQY